MKTGELVPQKEKKNNPQISFPQVVIGFMSQPGLVLQLFHVLTHEQIIATVRHTGVPG